MVSQSKGGSEDTFHSANETPEFIVSERGEGRLEGADWRINPYVYDFVGATFDPLTFTQTLNQVSQITRHHSFRYVMMPDFNHFILLNKDPEIYGPLFETSWLSICGSRTLETFANLSGVPLKFISASDLIIRLLRSVVEPNEPINIIGANDEIIASFKETYGLTILNHHDPFTRLKNQVMLEDETIIAAANFVSQNPVRYTFICVESPQQEMIAKACLDRGDCLGLALCVGTSFEIITGIALNTPKFITKYPLGGLYKIWLASKRLWTRYCVEGPRVIVLWLKWTLVRK